MSKKQLTGTIVSDAMNKTVVVAVDSLRQHPKYHRRYRVTKRYKAHDEANEFRTGEKVVIEEARPLSKEKRWRVVGKASTAGNTKNA